MRGGARSRRKWDHRRECWAPVPKRHCRGGRDERTPRADAAPSTGQSLSSHISSDAHRAAGGPRDTPEPEATAAAAAQLPARPPSREGSVSENIYDRVKAKKAAAAAATGKLPEAQKAARGRPQHEDAPAEAKPAGPASAAVAVERKTKAAVGIAKQKAAAPAPAKQKVCSPPEPEHALPCIV
jgi:hypothetical protein